MIFLNSQRTFRGAFLIGLLLVGLFSIRTEAEVLYKAEWDDRTLWLLGTIHLASQSRTTLSEVAQQALLDSDYIWMEMTAEELERSSSLLFAAGTRDTPFLRDEIEEEAWNELAALSARLGLAPSVIERMEPWLTEYVLLVMVLRAEGFDTRQSIDHQVMRLAAMHDKTILGFETAEMQVATLRDAAEQLSYPYHIARILAQIESVTEEAKRLERLWQEGDLDTLYSFTTQALSAHSKHVLLVERNQAWFRTLITEVAEHEQHFIAVGAGHLPGEQGLLELLTRAGAKVSKHGPP